MSEYTSKEIAKLACEALADKKADDIKVDRHLRSFQPS